MKWGSNLLLPIGVSAPFVFSATSVEPYYRPIRGRRKYSHIYHYIYIYIYIFGLSVSTGGGFTYTHQFMLAFSGACGVFYDSFFKEEIDRTLQREIWFLS